jgi:hypothetical protein
MLPDRVFAAIERFGLYLADLARMFARNPLHFLTGWAKRLGSTRYRKEEIDSTDSRLSIGVMGTVLLLGFAIIVVLLLV